MIVLFTDFGWHGPYVGQMKSVLLEQSPNTPIIDLMHDAPNFSIKPTAYLLASLVTSFPKGTVFLAVVDPGVGSERDPCIVKADDYWFVGPDNGLFNIVLNQANSKEKWKIIWQPETLSSTFHGRDLFAPMAVEVATKDITTSNKVSQLTIEANDWPENLYEIIYIEHYGNCMSGIRKSALVDEINNKQKLSCKEKEFKFADTFSSVKQGEALWYINSNGLCELAVNQGSAAQLFELKIGDTINFI